MAVRPPLCESIPSVYVKWNKVEERLEDRDTDEEGGGGVWREGVMYDKMGSVISVCGRGVSGKKAPY